jgi:hypothetical protein
MAHHRSRDFKPEVAPVAGDVPTVGIICVPPIESKMPPITINDPSARRILSVGLSKLEAEFTKVYWKQNIANEQSRKRIVKINGYSIEIYKAKGGKPVKVLSTRDVINVYDPSINPRCTQPKQALDIIAYEKDEKLTRYLITLQMEKNPSVAAFACREMFTSLQTAIQHGYVDVVVTTVGEDGETSEIKHMYVILRPPFLHFYESFSSLAECRAPISMDDLKCINAPSDTPEALAQFPEESRDQAFDLVFTSATTLTLAAASAKHTEDEVHSHTLADILRSWRSQLPRALVNSDFRFARYFLTKEREVGFGFVLGLRSQALPTDRPPFFWESKPQIRVVMLSKYKNGVLGPSGRAGIRLNDVIIAINGDTKIRTISDCARHLKGSLEAFVDVLRLPLHENVCAADWAAFGDAGLKSIYIPVALSNADAEAAAAGSEEDLDGASEPGEMPLKVSDAVEASVRQSMAWRRASLLTEGEIPLPMMAGGSDPEALFVDVGEGEHVGLTLEWDAQLNFPVVKAFTRDPKTGAQGVVETGGMVSVGMVLGTINGEATFNSSLESVLTKLDVMPRPLRLEFMTPTGQPGAPLDTVDEDDDEDDEDGGGGGGEGVDLPEVSRESVKYVEGLNLQELDEDSVSAEYAVALLEVIDTEGLQYLHIRNALVEKLGRALTEAEKLYIKKHLGRLELQRITELEDERLRKLAQLEEGAESPSGGGGGGAGKKKTSGFKKVRQMPPATKPPGMSPDEWRRLLSTIENSVEVGPTGDYEMYSKTVSGRYKRVVVDLAEVAGQKYAAGLITQEQYDQILDDLSSGKTVVGDVF